MPCSKCCLVSRSTRVHTIATAFAVHCVYDAQDHLVAGMEQQQALASRVEQLQVGYGSKARLFMFSASLKCAVKC